MNRRTVSRFLDLRALAALAYLRFAPRQRIEGTYSGRHTSRRLGGSGEFADFREHTPGEDLRRLDWKVLARTGRPYTRIYQDETNLIGTLVMDASRSMQFGANPTKWEYTQYLATAISYVISRQQDQVGLAVIADKLREYVSPGSTVGHVEHLHTLIENLDLYPETELAVGLHALYQKLSRRGVLIVFSDFLVEDLEAFFTAVRMFRHSRWDVILLHIVHPQEEWLPEGAAYRFEGLENEGRTDCSPADIRALYQDRFERHAATLRSLALACGCDYRRVSTAVPYLQTLGEFLVERNG